MARCGIYKVTFNGKETKSYVGQSGDPEKRWDCGTNVRGQCLNPVNCHLCSAKRGSSLPLHNDIRQHGVEAFSFVVLERCKVWELNDRELFHIAAMVNRREYTYNLIAVRKERDPSLYNGKDVGNPYIVDKPRKAPKEYRRFTPRELANLPTLRSMGYSMEQIGLLHGCTPQAVGKALKRLTAAQSENAA